MKIKLLLVLLLLASRALSQQVRITPLPSQPYDKYELRTGNDTITFYLSVTSAKNSLPLIVYIQGSSMSSLFIDRNGRITSTSGHMTWFDVGNDKYRILVVEKPGIHYLQNGSSQAFDKKFSLESWSETITAAINYVTQNVKIDSNKILVAGHSEGGVVASRVANRLKDKVANVAIMAGEGPSQLYSLYKLAEDGIFFNTKEHNMPTSEERIKYLTNKWTDILSNPTSTDNKFWGFTYLRWSSMLKTSVIDELGTFDGNILIVQGTDDKAVYPESAIISYTTLLSKGKKVSLEQIPNANHSFSISDKPEIDGWKMVIEKVVKWFDDSSK